jgi:hypothetical protein
MLDQVALAAAFLRVLCRTVRTHRAGGSAGRYRSFLRISPYALVFFFLFDIGEVLQDSSSSPWPDLFPNEEFPSVLPAHRDCHASPLPALKWQERGLRSAHRLVMYPHP